MYVEVVALAPGQLHLDGRSQMRSPDTDDLIAIRLDYRSRRPATWPRVRIETQCSNPPSGDAATGEVASAFGALGSLSAFTLKGQHASNRQATASTDDATAPDRHLELGRHLELARAIGGPPWHRRSITVGDETIDAWYLEHLRGAVIVGERPAGRFAVAAGGADPGRLAFSKVMIDPTADEWWPSCAW